MEELLSCLFPVTKILVSSMYIIADMVIDASEMAETINALNGTVARINNSMILMAIHMGPAEPLPCPPPCNGLTGDPS